MGPRSIWRTHIEKWIQSDKPFAHKLVAFSIVEAIFFSGAFASIFWVKTLPGGPLNGLRTANKFIAKDEHMHVELACIIYSHLKNRICERVIHDMFREAVEIEHVFIDESLPKNLAGMNSDLMLQYIQYCADQLLVQLGYKKLYDVTNPFEFMKKIDNYIKQDFFNDRNDVYTNASIGNTREWVIMDDGY